MILVASPDDCRWISLDEKCDVDLNDLYRISLVLSLLYDPEDECFYILANKEGDSIGIYLVKFYVNHPGKFKFITMWRHLLDIGDAYMAISKGVDNHSSWYKELIVGFKTIYINTYNINVIDLAKNAT